MTTETTVSRHQRLAELAEELGVREEAKEEALAQDTLTLRWALVERSLPRIGMAWLSLHESPAAASNYHLDQEYPEDWHPECLVDLDTGKRFTPHTQMALRWDDDGQPFPFVPNLGNACGHSTLDHDCPTCREAERTAILLSSDPLAYVWLAVMSSASGAERLSDICNLLDARGWPVP